MSVEEEKYETEILGAHGFLSVVCCMPHSLVHSAFGEEMEEYIYGVASGRRDGHDLTETFFADQMTFMFRLAATMKAWQELMKKPASELHVEDGAIIIAKCA